MLPSEAPESPGSFSVPPHHASEDNRPIHPRAWEGFRIRTNLFGNNRGLHFIMMVLAVKVVILPLLYPRTEKERVSRD
jgi:hypothetical protein